MRVAPNAVGPSFGASIVKRRGEFMAVLDDFVTRRWLIAIAILTFALQVFISQRISLFIPSGKITHIVQPPDNIIGFKVSDEIYSNEFFKVDNSENIFYSDKRYVFALIFCNSLLYLLILGRRLRWPKSSPFRCSRRVYE